MNDLNNQKSGDIIRITTTINCGTDIPAVNVIPLKVNEVGKMHGDILLGDIKSIVDDAKVDFNIKKAMGKRLDVTDIMRSYGTFAKAARTLVKSSDQELPVKTRRNMYNSGNSKNDVFHKRLKNFLNHEIHIKLEGDEGGVLYKLKEIEKDFLVVKYGESQRFIPINKIIFLQIGDYPKD